MWLQWATRLIQLERETDGGTDCMGRKRAARVDTNKVIVSTSLNEPVRCCVRQGVVPIDQGEGGSFIYGCPA